MCKGSIETHTIKVKIRNGEYFFYIVYTIALISDKRFDDTQSN
jgi:hypothetical protein